MQNKLTISILDKQYAIATDEQCVDIERAAMRVDQLLRVKMQHGFLVSEKTVIIAALELAVELCKQESRLREQEGALQRLINLCE